jgi:glycosyltransferase involved in cell wall biosynthesis
MIQTAHQLLPEVDIIHCHEFRTTENLIVTPLAAKHRTPLVLSPHGTLNQTTGRSGLKMAWDRWLSPAVARRFDQVIGLTEDEVSEVRPLWTDFGGKANFSVIPNGVDPDTYTNLPGRETFRERYNLGDAPVCLFMGRLHPRKGVGLLVDAFKAANVPNARLVIAGPDEGMLAQLKAASDDRIVLTGYLDGDDRLAALAAADLLALPAVGEGLPMIVLEAMAAGLPVIVSPECHVPEVEAYGAGIQVEPMIEPLCDALRLLLTDTDRRKAMGQTAQGLVRERFTWDAAAEQLEAVYLQLLSSS